MIRKNRPRSSSLFLMELILAILFFSVASAVCVQIFVKSHLLSQKAGALNEAVNLCTNVAETISASPEQMTKAPDPVYYTADFSLCEKPDASYVLSVQTTYSDSFLEAHIQMEDIKGTTIYALDNTYHLQRRIAHEER